MGQRNELESDKNELKRTNEYERREFKFIRERHRLEESTKRGGRTADVTRGSMAEAQGKTEIKKFSVKLPK